MSQNDLVLSHSAVSASFPIDRTAPGANHHNDEDDDDNNDGDDYGDDYYNDHDNHGDEDDDEELLKGHFTSCQLRWKRHSGL